MKGKNTEMSQYNNEKPLFHVTLNLNARFQPMHRYELEDALEELLAKSELGYVDGGGTMQFPSGEIKSCDIELMLRDDTEESIKTLESFIEMLGVAKGSKLLLWNQEDDAVQEERLIGNLEGMALYVNGSELPKEVYKNCNISHVIEQTELQMEGIGRLYSWWQGPQKTALYFYGRSYEAMLAAVSDFVKTYPLCQKCVIKKIA